MPYTSVNNGVGSAARRFKMSKASRNYTTQYFQNCHATGDIRAYYIHQSYTGVGSGEVFRAIAEAKATGCAAGATINAAHFTGRVGTLATISGALNALRVTLETADTTVCGGTLAALNLDSDLISGSAHALNSSAFIRVSQSGADALDTLMMLPATEADGHSADVLSTAGVDKPATHYVRILLGSTPAWVMVTTTAPAHS